MPRSDKELEILNPVATALGRAVIEWNDMHESFSLLYAAVLYPSEPFSAIALDSWHVNTSDKSQRDMLKAAAIAAAPRFPAHSKFADDVTWLCERAQSLSDQRNNMVHAPLTFRLDDQGQPTGVVASVFFGHPRAMKLDGKDLIEEFAKYTEYAEALKFFARQIVSAIQFGPVVSKWPTRPSLPSLRQNPAAQVSGGTR